GSTIEGNYIKQAGMKNNLGQHLMAVVAEGQAGRTYCTATRIDESAASVEIPEAVPSAKIGIDPRNIWVTNYALDEWWKLFSPRQLMALTTFSDLLKEVRAKIEDDAHAAGFANDGIPLRDGGTGSTAYADAIVTYLAFAIDRMADRQSTICGWDKSRES